MLKQHASARLKRRYLLVKGTHIDIERALLEYVGILGWSRAAPVIESIDQHTVILAINRQELVHVRAALMLYARPLEIIRVSGTIKGLGIRA